MKSTDNSFDKHRTQGSESPFPALRVDGPIHAAPCKSVRKEAGCGSLMKHWQPAKAAISALHRRKGAMRDFG